MKKTTLSILVSILVCLASGHPWKAQQFVIIDTDGGLDDFRAINLILASPDIRVLAIVNSNGVLEAGTGYGKLCALMTDLGHEGILKGAYGKGRKGSVNCTGALEYEWGTKSENCSAVPDAGAMVQYILQHTEDQISFICLGSLDFAAACYEDIPDFRVRVGKIIWTGGGDISGENFNYSLSPESYRLLVKQNNIPLISIDAGLKNQYYSSALLDELKEAGNQYTEKIMDCIENSAGIFSRKIFDEMAALYLHNPGLFMVESRNGENCYSLSDTAEIPVLFEQILHGQADQKNQVLKLIPGDTAAYQSDVAGIMEEAINKYGKEEWNAGVLANELHRHLGVYATIGVKMGIRAREYFGAGIDEMYVLSHAGLTPPFSCMNDGLQVSTGATLGHGLIEVSPDPTHLPRAEFTYLGQKIAVELRNEYREKIEGKIKELATIHGLNSDIYWQLVREEALYFWFTWDRREIFRIEILD